ncbi:hypothetical protein HJG60_009912 [Phyllostomus discolor]|uniref:Uncharacterized protein n=1 Tax=Phyllostomus discolor TaxID=89673 RepID=A0A834EQ35_9CHIR|nr:hypothetical protein HJG60_009912 [Phyllostomus discolor]
MGRVLPQIRTAGSGDLKTPEPLPAPCPPSICTSTRLGVRALFQDAPGHASWRPSLLPGLWVGVHSPWAIPSQSNWPICAFKQQALPWSCSTPISRGGSSDSPLPGAPRQTREHWAWGLHTPSPRADP